MWAVNLLALLCACTTTQAILLATGKVCFGDLGCFTNEGEFNALERPVNFLPSTPKEIDAKYWLVNRDDPTGVPLKYNDDVAIFNSSFVPTKDTKFVIHGYKSSTEKSWVHVAAAELLKHGDYNVFIVDWKKAAAVTYGKACANARVVGAEIAVLLLKLEELMGANLMTFHLIGSNVGAHIAGYAGERLSGLGRITGDDQPVFLHTWTDDRSPGRVELDPKRETYIFGAVRSFLQRFQERGVFRVGLLKGLDPTAPYFENTGPSVHLDRTDAEFVDVIHTDTGNSFDFAFGMHSQVGHVDFYPNGGQYQPGCPKTKITGSIVGGIMGLINHDKGLAREKFMCSHRRAESLFIESINSVCPFNSFPCTSIEDLHNGACLHEVGEIGRMGLKADEALGRGVQMLETFDKSPFCTFHYQIDVSGASTINGKILLTITGTKGSTGPLDVAGHNKLLSPHDHFKTIVKTNIDIGELKSIELKYLETSNLIKVIFDNDWKLESLKLFQASTQKEYNFCVKGIIITSTTSKTFAPSDSCS